MLTTSAPPSTPIDLNLLNPIKVIEAMIDLRIQLEQIETQIDALKLAFYAACATLNAEEIERDRALITRRLTPGQWAYSPDVLEQEIVFKQVKQQFQKQHEPTGDREVIWAVKYKEAFDRFFDLLEEFCQSNQSQTDKLEQLQVK